MLAERAGGAAEGHRRAAPDRPGRPGQFGPVGGVRARVVRQVRGSAVPQPAGDVGPAPRRPRVVAHLRMRDDRRSRPAVYAARRQCPLENDAAPPGGQQAADDKPPVLGLAAPVVQAERRAGRMDRNLALPVAGRQHEFVPVRQPGRLRDAVAFLDTRRVQRKQARPLVHAPGLLEIGGRYEFEIEPGASDERVGQRSRQNDGEMHRVAEEGIAAHWQYKEGGKLAAELKQQYGFGPQIASLFDPKPFWFYMVLEGDGEALQVPLPETLDKASLERSLNAALQRLTPGALKTVALVKPQGFGPGGQRYGDLENVLGENVRIKESDLKSGRAPDDADLLLVMAPKALDEKQRFAIDQFLMQGGSVVLATSSFDVQVSGNLNASKQESGLDEWLAHHGITVDETMLLDPQNAALPVPTERYIGGLALREIRMLPYPHFPDLRSDGLNPDNPITASLGQLTLNWASPVTIDEEKNKGRKVIPLLESTDKSWLSSSTMIQPDFQTHGDLGFAVEGEQGQHLLAAVVEGGFTSYFTGKPSPLLKKDEETPEPSGNPGEQEEEEQEEQVIIRQLDKSPETARIILFGSSSFLSDTVLGITSSVMRTDYLGPVQLIANTVDWSLEDRGLLSIRGRSHFSRPLNPITKKQQLFWEYLNYGLVLLGLALIWLLRLRIRKQAEERQLAFLQQPETGRVSS